MLARSCEGIFDHSPVNACLAEITAASMSSALPESTSANNSSVAGS